MIITLTANPSLDRTVTLTAPLVPGGVHRIAEDATQAGGKGVNVSRALHQAGEGTLAVLPAGAQDPFTALLAGADLPHRTVPVAGPVRTNLTVVSPPGVTTKINEPGHALTPAEAETLATALHGATRPGDFVMLSGSLAPGLPADWYARRIQELHEAAVPVGVDTSDAPLAALAAAWRADRCAAPDLLTPNAEELGQLTGADSAAIESAAEQGELAPVAEAARALHAQGVGAVLVTLGAAGAVLATAEGTWHCAAVPGEVLSTVGAGDSAAAGYLLARVRGREEPERLACAVAYGTAAVALPGTTIPHPDQVAVREDLVRAL
ncbi:1-phosphofructokinase family hexose kinase [Brachybacterium squillarum]|uniref:1-phosphofructokinase family hexose kinase n=1 Tax=Brachybacterium squillarum TaxID=661979 RepID=UPI0022216067|nr:1-phosphofructokinase family hexose kinase [Brachybacterium squillarum]MCW1804412.1 1-phosphofructokinase family hexose kinase [Brachybacterium squillarum]